VIAVRPLGVTAALATTIALALTGSHAAARPSGPPVKLMLISEFSGGSNAPEIANGAKAAVKALNRRDGINGNPVALTVCDTRNDPDRATECGQQAVDGKYLAGIGSESVQASRYLPVLEQAQIPMVGNDVVDTADFLNPASFPLSGGILATIGGLADALADAGSTKIAVAYTNAARGVIVPTLANMALKRHNLEVVDKVAIPDRAPAMTRYVEAATANGADGIILAISDRDAISFVRSYVSSGQAGMKFAVAAADAAAVHAVVKGEKKVDVYGSASYDQRNAKFLNDMTTAGYKRAPVDGQVMGYAAVMAVARASHGLATVDAPSLYAKLPTVNALDLGSILPVVDFTKAGQVSAAAPRVSNLCIKTTKLVKADFVIQSKSWTNAYTGATCPAG
jgi:ABC-type branched-subunit amino acid transport system substrate-binding protein